MSITSLDTMMTPVTDCLDGSPLRALVGVRASPQAQGAAVFIFRLLIRMDPDRNAPTLLFHPRTDFWADHFRVEKGMIVGLSPEGGRRRLCCA